MKLRSAWGSSLLGWAPTVSSGLPVAQERGREALASNKGAEVMSECPGKAAFPGALPSPPRDHTSSLKLPLNMSINLQG